MSDIGGHVEGFARTKRTDSWWVNPTVVFLGLSAWLLYYFWSAMSPTNFVVGPYLSPFYSPLLMAPEHTHDALHASSHHALLGDRWFSWWPAILPASPAFLIAAFPGTFRVTCYYYRKAYYRAFAAMPPACSVNPAPQNPYKGETGLLLFQNLHRYTLYFAIALLPFLYYDAALSFTYNGQLGVGVGSIFILCNALFLTGYTFGCHAWRHLSSGRLDCFSCSGSARAQFSVWKASTWFNGRHMFWAWLSLIWIAVADAYVRLVANGVIPDLNTWSDF